MPRVRRWIAACGIALSMSGCTLLGLGMGGAVAGSRNSDPRVEMGQKPRTSVGKSMALGAAIGLAVDVAFVALAVSTQSGPGH